MKKLIVAGLVAGLVVGSVAAPAAAKKKKPKAPVSVDQKIFLRQDSDSCQTPHTFLSATDGADLSCFYTDAGAPYEVVNQIAPITTADWALEDTVPFVFDTSRKLTGEITVHGGSVQGTYVSAGQARFDLVVTADVGGETKEIGTLSETWVTTPTDVHVIKLDMTIDPALAGQQVTSFALATTMRGAAIGPHTIELDSPASFVTVPMIK